MEFTPDDGSDLVTEMDVRGVTVLWSNDHEPVCSLVGGLSGYEAVGLLRAVIQRLEDDNASDIEFEDDLVNEDGDGDDDG